MDAMKTTSKTQEDLIAYDISNIILSRYLSYYYQFKRITKRAKLRFEEKDWHGIQSDSRGRIRLYRDVVTEARKEIEVILEGQVKPPLFWKEVKHFYFEEVSNFNTRNIAETFYNSVYRYYHQGLGADEQLMFVRGTGTYREYRSTIPIYHTFFLTTDLKITIQQIFHYYTFEVPYANLNQDIESIYLTLSDYVDPVEFKYENARIEMLKSVFYRNKSAYLVGRLRVNEHFIPFVLPLIHHKNGIRVNALLISNDDVSSIFSYHRAYFLADVDIVSETVDFLQSILPQKNLSELYNSIGFEKHGKTVFYREFIRHLNRTEDQFEEAPGIRGMVMFVFTLPSLNMVFKVIKDSFDPPKKITTAEVKEKYKLVNLHDRVGRMTDTHVFEHLSFERKRFSEELLEELKKVIPSRLTIGEDEVKINHLYVEKRMIPLNIYLENASEEEAKEAINEYGQAIKELAAANIFPGDLLLKNFGVTRLKRVVFYDYDEIGFLTDYFFREIPEPRDEYEEMSSEPYFHVGPNDIFPEEFRRFIIHQQDLKAHFETVHGDLFDFKYWKSIQNRLQAGEIINVYPYKQSIRFVRKYKDAVQKD